MNKEKKDINKAIDLIKLHEGDTGSSGVQIAIFTNRIEKLKEHIDGNGKDSPNKHKKDLRSIKGLLGLVNKRKRLINYLKKNDFAKLKQVTEELNIRVKS